MGERNKVTDAIILTVQETGENNRKVCALSPEYGIFYATLYGGGKSKLKSLVQPFYSGKMWVYADEAKHSMKVSDFDVKNSHVSFRTSIYKIWAANLACEIMLKTKCAGDDVSSYTLLSAFLDGIDAVEEKEARLGTLRFLWRYLSLLGIQPDTHTCIQCGKEIDGNGVLFVHSYNGFVCSDCSNYNSQETAYSLHTTFECDREMLFYLSAINEQTPGKVRALTISAESAYKMKALLFYLIESACGSKLKSLESGLGIL